MEGDKDSVSGDKSKPFSSFRDIRMSTMGETYKNLNKIIEDPELQKSERFKRLISSVSPLPVFDESLRLITINRLQLRNEVINILLSQNDNQIKGILRCKWFFKDLPFIFCTTELFPHVSFSLRCKIITSLSKQLESENEAEKYFLFVRRHYSNQRADLLLPRCSGQFISDHFQKHQPLFDYPAGVRVLLNICRRHPEVGLHMLNCIFDLKKKSSSLAQYRSVFQYMAGHHFESFAPFVRKYYLVMGLEVFGKKLTKKLGRELEEHLFSEFENTSIFTSKTLFRVLSPENKVKFLAGICGFRNKELSLSSWTTSAARMGELLRLLGPKDRLPLIEATFRRLYNSDFHDHSNCWSRDLLELLPVELRLLFVRKLNKFFQGDRETFEKNVNCSFSIDSPEEFVHLYDCPTAFFRFKELLGNAPQPGKRQNILRSMVKNCSINADVESLEVMVDFVATRHRNDDSPVVYAFIEAVCQEFPWTALTSAIFEKLEDLINLCALKGNPNPHVHMEWRERHLYHLMDKGLETGPHMKDFLLNIVIETCYYRFLQDYKCRHSKALLLAFGALGVKWIRRSKSESAARILLLCILRTCDEFSKAHKGRRILREVPGLAELLLEKAKAEFEDLGGAEWPVDVWERYSEKVLDARYSPECLLFVYKRRPHLLKSHLEGVLANCLKYYSKTFRSLCDFMVKTWSFYDQTEKPKGLLLRDLKSRRKICSDDWEMYSRLSSIEEFEKVAGEYIPKQEQVEIESYSHFGAIQLMIPRMIRNVRPRWRNFDLILKFLKGDFLHTVMPTLRSCCQHTRVDVVVPFLKHQLRTLPRKVSCQKDIIRLIAELCPRDERVAFCLDCWNEYHHYSIRTILFNFISKEFTEQPSQESFRVLEKCVLESEPPFIDRRPPLHQTPGEFLHDYVNALFRFSERQAPAYRNDFQQFILSHFQGNNIALLSSDFCQKIISSHLFNTESRLQVGEFACFYLMADPNAVQARTQMVLDLIRDAKPDSSSVSDFLHTLLRHSEAPPYADVLALVLNSWPDCPPGILYEERLLFEYNSLHQQVLREGLHSDAVPVALARELKRFFCGEDNLKELVPVYAEALSSFFRGFETLEAVLMVRELVAGAQDRALAVLGVLALPRAAIGWFRGEKGLIGDSVRKAKAALSEIVGILEGYGDRVVEIYMRRRFFN